MLCKGCCEGAGVACVQAHALPIRSLIRLRLIVSHCQTCEGIHTYSKAWWVYVGTAANLYKSIKISLASYDSTGSSNGQNKAVKNENCMYGLSCSELVLHQVCLYHKSASVVNRVPIMKAVNPAQSSCLLAKLTGEEMRILHSDLWATVVLCVTATISVKQRTYEVLFVLMAGSTQLLT